MFNHKEKGVSIFFTLIIMGILLSTVLGLGAILLGQIKTMEGMGNSVKALYAADTGIEKALNDDPPIDYFSSTIDGAYYEVWVKCCKNEESTCYLEANECESIYFLEEDENCEGHYFCYESKGSYRETRRAIEITR